MTDEQRIAEVELTFDGVLDEAREAIHDRIDDMWFAFSHGMGTSGSKARHGMAMRAVLVEALGEERTQAFIVNEWEKFHEEFVQWGGNPEHWRIFTQGTPEERATLMQQFEEEEARLQRQRMGR